MTQPATGGGRWQRLFERARTAWRLGGSTALLRLTGDVLRTEAFKCRAAGWHLRSAIRHRCAAGGSLSTRATNDALPLAFDLLGCNPIGWRPHSSPVVAALGPPHLLPSSVPAQRIVRWRDARRLRRVHHVEDVQAFHRNDETRASALVRLAAAGVIVHLADAPNRLLPLLGSELYELMTADMGDLDADARELLGVRMRRVALREHSSCVHAWRYGKSMPLVSILLASKRPDFLQWAIANVVKQTYPRVELIVALHGDGFMDAEQCIASLPHPTRVLRIPASEPLGTVLDAATAASSGSLLTKMDDDDVYGADHLWDLVLAHEYSQAPLVGKWLEFVYLAESNLTVRWFSGYGDRYQTSGPAGGTMLLSRCDLARYGGWPAVASGVDTALANNILRAGGVVYRTHAAGFMLVRHGGGHTWHDRRTTDRAFVAEADCVWSGFHPGRAGIEPSTTPHPAIDQPQ